MLIELLKRPVKLAFHSVFTKLIAVMFVSGSLLVIVISAISWHGFRENRRIFFQNNLAQYGAYLVRDLQENLNLEYARELSQRLFLVIRFEGKNDSWQTASGIPPLDKVNFRKLEGKSRIPVNPKFSDFETNFRFGRHQKQGIVIVDTKSGRFIIAASDSWRELRQVLPWILTILGLIGLILLVTWLTLRWILKPINWLSGGVAALGKGNLEHRLPEKRSDELGDLSLAFNQMSESLRDMLGANERLLLDVSHELRSPLTRMKVALEFIPENSTRQSLLMDINEMEQMVTEILETARLKSKYGKLDRQPIDLAIIIEEVCLSFEGVKPGIQFENLGKNRMAQVDAKKIESVLKNLIANALKYSPPENAKIKVSLIHNDFGIEVEIMDYGQGIPLEEQDFIFEPFYRIDKSRNKSTGGYGLGLSLSKNIVEAHGGTITVLSKLGEGTIFKFNIPNSPKTI